MDAPLGVDVSRETLNRLIIYRDLLAKWTPRINLVSPATVADAWQRHFVDSAQLWRLRPDAARTWIDLGSGGGFPGLVIAIIAAEAAPEMSVTLVESDARKSTFLRTVMRDVGVDARLVTDRAEKMPPAGADVVSARAVAPLDRLLTLAERHMSPGGIGLFPKGANVGAEVDAALARWAFHCEKHPSRTDAEAVILKIEDLSRA